MIVAAALAAAPPNTERDAWPALPVEQPVVTPRGWLRAEASGPTWAGELRYGFAERTELVLGGEVGTGSWFGGRRTVVRSEVPGASLAVEGAVEAVPGGALAGSVGLRGAVRTGPVRWSGGVDPRWDGVLGLRTDAQVLLQVGPVAPAVEGRWTAGSLPEWGWGVQVNLTRGLAPWVGAIGGEVVGGVRLAL